MGFGGVVRAQHLELCRWRGFGGCTVKPHWGYPGVPMRSRKQSTLLQLPSPAVILLMGLLSLPASASRTVFTNSCDGKQPGDACNDRYSKDQPGTCVESRCLDSNYFFALGAMGGDDEGLDDETGRKIEVQYFDCNLCQNPEQLAEARRGRLLLWLTRLGAVGALGAVGFVWHRRRRRSKAMTPPPEDVDRVSDDS
jgi:hypothetical protein